MLTAGAQLIKHKVEVKEGREEPTHESGVVRRGTTPDYLRTISLNWDGS